jgi:hypothetical protein
VPVRRPASRLLMVRSLPGAGHSGPRFGLRPCRGPRLNERRLREAARADGRHPSRLDEPERRFVLGGGDCPYRQPDPIGGGQRRVGLERGAGRRWCGLVARRRPRGFDQGLAGADRGLPGLLRRPTFPARTRGGPRSCRGADLGRPTGRKTQNPPAPDTRASGSRRRVCPRLR